MKHCYIRMDHEFHVYHDNRYIEVMLTENDEGTPMCHLSGCDDWELSVTGSGAQSVFDSLLYVSGDVSFDYLLQLGFRQYG